MPKVELVKVLERHQGQRLDNYLIRHLKGVPRSRIYRIIRRGEVRVNKKRCKPERKLQRGDEIRIPPVTVTSGAAAGVPSPALKQLLLDRVLHEDEQLLVINKPAGLAVHGGSGIRLGLIEAIRQIKPDWAAVELAHRLDRATSGCLIMAKNPVFLKQLQQQFKARTVDKRYLALVHGCWPDSLVEVDAPLRKDTLSSGERMVRVMPAGKPSLTRFRVVKRYRQATLIEALPASGRTHQIRVHCQHAGHPIVGDTKYGRRGGDETLALAKNLCLHASEIRFQSPTQSGLLKIQAPLDPQLSTFLVKLSEK